VVFTLGALLSRATENGWNMWIWYLFSCDTKASASHRFYPILQLHFLFLAQNSRRSGFRISFGTFSLKSVEACLDLRSWRKSEAVLIKTHFRSNCTVNSIIATTASGDSHAGSRGVQHPYCCESLTEVFWNNRKKLSQFGQKLSENERWQEVFLDKWP